MLLKPGGRLWLCGRFRGSTGPSNLRQASLAGKPPACIPPLHTVAAFLCGRNDSVYMDGQMKGLGGSFFAPAGVQFFCACRFLGCRILGVASEKRCLFFHFSL